MTDAFHSAEIRPNGISVKVGTHRRAIGVGDYKTKAAFTSAVADMLADVLGDDLALVAANVAAAETDASAKIAELKAVHAAALAAHTAEKAALEDTIAVLGTKEEAQAIRKQQARAEKMAQLAALQAELAADDLRPTDAKP